MTDKDIEVEVATEEMVVEKPTGKTTTSKAHKVIAPPVVYNTLDDVPKEYRAAVRAAIGKYGIDGNPLLVDGNLRLTDDKLWFVQMMYRCRTFM